MNETLRVHCLGNRDRRGNRRSGIRNLWLLRDGAAGAGRYRIDLVRRVVLIGGVPRRR